VALRREDRAHQGLSGHSDADVAIHALVDALLGAIAPGDIGEHFPPSDRSGRAPRPTSSWPMPPSWCARRPPIAHVDVTIICEAPKIGPHRAAMQTRLAEIMEVPEALVSVKATTTEKPGLHRARRRHRRQAAAVVVRA
jgi:2-C-methyl-D-erythritol 4-phosphate cytidylyltransferase/2-C-methyl-D-erythritol 2,4-cyclodiphosphate synthase